MFFVDLKKTAFAVRPGYPKSESVLSRFTGKEKGFPNSRWAEYGLTQKSKQCGDRDTSTSSQVLWGNRSISRQKKLPGCRLLRLKAPVVQEFPWPLRKAQGLPMY